MQERKNRLRGILVSPEDVYLIKKYSFSTSDGRPVTYMNGKLIRLHTLIMPEAEIVDHINMNTLDNRRENLRAATKSQNMANRSKTKKNTSGYKGVTKNRLKWKATIVVNYEIIALGTYETKEEAALMYDIAAKKYFGDFARLNFNLDI